MNIIFIFWNRDLLLFLWEKWFKRFLFLLLQLLGFFPNFLMDTFPFLFLNIFIILLIFVVFSENVRIIFCIML